MNEEQLEQWRHERKVENDPRITKLGGFLRRTSIDEFPQFVNVLLRALPTPFLSKRID